MPSEVTRSAKVMTRVTPAEHRRLQALAAAQNRTLANFLYTVIKSVLQNVERRTHDPT